MESSDEISGTLPAGVSSQLTKPGTLSSIFPLTAGFLGPQHGSLPASGPQEAGCANVFSSVSVICFPHLTSRNQVITENELRGFQNLVGLPQNDAATPCQFSEVIVSAPAP
jgi:hypothetical protein